MDRLISGQRVRDRTELARRLIAGLALLGLVWLSWQLVFRTTQMLGNSDVFWQARTGELALATGHMPDTDPFSYTIQGEPWNNHEWVFELLAALLHRAGGWGALRLLVLAGWGGAALAIGVTVGRRAGPAAALLTLELFHLWAGYKLKPVPQMVSMLFFLAALHFFRGPVMLRSRRRAAAMVGLLLVWGNVTAEALTFLPFLLLDQLCLRLGRREGEAPDRTTTLLTVLACLVPLLNPPWASTLDYAVRGTAINYAFNLEFTPLWAAAATVQPLAKHAARVVVLLYVLWAARRVVRADDRREALRTCGAGLLAVASATLIERNLWLLVMPVAQMLAALARSERPVWRLGAGVSALGLGLVLHLAYAAQIRWSTAAAWAEFRDPRYRSQHINAELVPVGCFEPLAKAPEGTRLYTLRMWASYAIWQLPQVRVFYDGRNLEYGREIQDAGQRVWAGSPGTLDILDATGTDVVVAWPGWGDAPGVQGGPWRQLVAGSRCAVFTRAPRPQGATPGPR